MCGRFDNFLGPNDLGRAFEAGVSDITDWTPRYNVAPGMHPPVLFNDGVREFLFARFGMRPSWWQHRDRDFINVRAETIAEKPFFQRQSETNRCVLPMTGFYEWHGSGNAKTPYRITSQNDGEPLAVACLWEIDEILGHNQVTFAVVTTEPNELMRPIHSRMPVILSNASLDRWLEPSTPLGELHRILTPCPSSLLRAYRVSRDVNNPNNDNAHLIRPS